jgi:hypothetical protein
MTIALFAANVKPTVSDMYLIGPVSFCDASVNPNIDDAYFSIGQLI